MKQNISCYKPLVWESAHAAARGVAFFWRRLWSGVFSHTPMLPHGHPFPYQRK